MPVPTTTNKNGSLTIAGSGIASIRHMTLETLSAIKSADKVYYTVCDPATEAFIQDNATGSCSDLTVYYDKEKSRYDTYVQMCEVMLREVRAGHNVLGVFYGHPGVFVSPSHRAIAIARAEGYKAEMLAGVSAEDYMFADLGFDPAAHGCVTYEATEMLLRKKQLNPATHNIIWQVGGVGVSNMIFDNARFHLLVDRLEDTFGPDHQVVHYIGAVLPLSVKTMETYTIADLRKEDVVAQFNPTSTLYIPPRDVSPNDPEVAQQLSSFEAVVRSKYPPPGWTTSEPSSALAYGPRERDAIAQLDSHVAPDSHKVLRASSAIRRLMADLALSPELLATYRKDPQAVVAATEGLTVQEKAALSLNKAGAIYGVMKATPYDIANNRSLSVADMGAINEPAALTTMINIHVTHV
ncbi:hypothetical protein HYDPIDRAFT_28991 [Hydnomerulius pinastri MD-312]|uniref:Tetrapyrrole methylase domain-containing protein n=1 Tax=Hydnomerulius pinastri MD-312 TaxID=994086 RepID=A0A0C9WEP7_9AGAM|nr:hypothetical protein HYDPIDRAFT_28991 [Hydnomerulius pinastri MD-312]